MESSARFRVNSPHVIHELFEDEVVIVNLDTGRYYCLQHAGADVWSLIVDRAALGRIVDAIEAGYDADREAIARAIESLTRDLVDEGLIVAESGEAGDDGDRVAPAPRESRRPFTSPSLQTFTDMQDLLLLDPIHDVDEHGWPIAKRE